MYFLQAYETGCDKQTELLLSLKSKYNDHVERITKYETCHSLVATTEWGASGKDSAKVAPKSTALRVNSSSASKECLKTFYAFSILY